MSLKASIIARLVFAAIEWVNRWFASRRPAEPDPLALQLPKADGEPPPPKPKRRTAKRAPIPPESLSGGQ